MIGNVIARRYARALFGLGRKQGLEGLERFGRDLDGIREAVESSGELSALLRNPLFTADEKMKVMGDILSRLGAGAESRNFIRLLADKERLSEIPAIAGIYGELLDAEKGIVRGEVVTAIALDASRKKYVLGELNKQTDKTLVLDYSVDPALIGGVLLKVGDRVLDASLRAQLSILKDHIKRGDEGHAN